MKLQTIVMQDRQGEIVKVEYHEAPRGWLCIITCERGSFLSSHHIIDPYCEHAVKARLEATRGGQGAPAKASASASASKGTGNKTRAKASASKGGFTVEDGDF